MYVQETIEDNCFNFIFTKNNSKEWHIQNSKASDEVSNQAQISQFHMFQSSEGMPWFKKKPPYLVTLDLPLKPPPLPLPFSIDKISNRQTAMILRDALKNRIMGHCPILVWPPLPRHFGTFWFEVWPPPSYQKLGHNTILFGHSKGLLTKSTMAW